MDSCNKSDYLVSDLTNGIASTLELYYDSVVVLGQATHEISKDYPDQWFAHYCLEKLLSLINVSE